MRRRDVLLGAVAIAASPSFTLASGGTIPPQGSRNVVVERLRVPHPPFIETDIAWITRDGRWEWATLAGAWGFDGRLVRFSDPEQAM